MDLETRSPVNLRPVSRTNAQRQEVSSAPGAESGLMFKLLLAVGTSLSWRSKARVVFIGLLTMGILGEIDIITGPEISFSIFYLIPVCFVTWRVGKFAGTLFSVISAAVWLFADIGSVTMYSSPSLALWNGAVRLGFFLIVTHTLSALSVTLELVRTDYLTGLTNGRGFHELAETEIHRSRRSGNSFTLAYVDVDDFKKVNDEHGHAGGDALLRLIASTLRKSTRRSDTIARLGGDEFAILLPESTYDSSDAAIQKIRENLQMALKDANWPVTFSIGAATFLSGPASVQAALEEADQLMYEAKRSGKNSLIHKRVTPVRAVTAS